MKFLFSQTSVKDLEKEETCPFRWKSQWLDGLIPFKGSEAMDKGSYFEYLVLGAGATIVTVKDLPRLKNGDKSIEQIRIEQQADRAKRILFDSTDKDWLGFTLKSSQLEMRDENRKGTIDVVVTDQGGATWILDLKLTMDLTSDRTKYGWGNDWKDLDLLQQTHYENLYMKTTASDGKPPRMGLLVMDYSTKKRVEFGEIIISDEKRSECEARFKGAEEVFNLYQTNGWVKVPNYTECEACPLSCDFRKEGSKLIKKTVNY